MSEPANKDSRDAKTCNMCANALPLSEFYIYKTGTTAGKPHAACKECQKRRARAWQNANRDYVSAYKKEYFRRPGNHERNLAHHRKAKERHPEKIAAREAVKSAIRSGKLVRQPCQKCAAPKGNAHHHDYSRPLDVEWLCYRCHGEEHRRENEAKRAAQ